MLSLALALLAAAPAAATPAAVCAVDATVDRVPSMLGDTAMAPAMDRLLALYRRTHPQAAAPVRWSSVDHAAAGALMFELVDMAPVAHSFLPTDIAPYEHQFHGDMMPAPYTVPIGLHDGAVVSIATNRRPGSPLPARITAFLALALSPQGQAGIAATPGFAPLPPEALADARARIGGFVAPLDPALAAYRPDPRLAGTITSIGSDGMKALMDGWECRFHALQPRVARGERWEHLGTLNGFHALLVGETDMAPMGRELWPGEQAAWRDVFATPAPIEIAVARGGFDTPQRTTAQAIFVHPSNPLTHLRLDQFAAIWGAHPTITRWGQLGLTGAWADRAIHLRMPPRVAPNAMSIRINVLHDGDWNPAAVQDTIAATAQALLDDPAAIGFGGLEEGAPGLKTLAIAARGENYVPLNADTAASGRYPLTRLMYIRLAARHPSPATLAFLRFILSHDGQERVRYSGYFPLSAAEAAAERGKLDALAK